MGYSHLRSSRRRATFVLVALCAFFASLAVLVGPARAQTATPVTFSGTLRDPNGVALPNVWVQLFDPSGSAQGGAAPTDGNGHFSFSVAPGTFTLSVTYATGNGALPAGASVPAGHGDWIVERTGLAVTGDTEHDITLPNSFVSLSVSVLGPDGSPVPGAVVSTEATVANNGTPPIPFDGATASLAETFGYAPSPTGSDGQAVISYWTPAAGSTDNIVVSPPTGSNLAPATVDNVNVTTDNSITVNLVHEVSYSGVLRDSDGLPLRNTWVQLINASVPEQTPPDAGGLTDSNGHFSLAAPPGSYNLEVSYDPQDGPLPSGALVPAGADLWAVDRTGVSLTADTVHDINLPGSFTHLAVKVVGPDGSPVAGAAVSYSGDVLNQGNPPIPFDGTTAVSASTSDSNDVSVPSDSNGLAELSFWAPAAGSTVNLSVTPPTNAGVVPGTLDNVDVSNDGTATVVLPANPLTITATADHQPTTAGWFSQPTTVSFQCADSDPAATVTSCPAPVTVSSQGSTPVSGTASDSAGRQASTTYTVNLDTTPPTINAAVDPYATAAATQPPTQTASGITWYRSPVTVAFTCSDALSGIASCPAPKTLASEGAKQSETGVATDLAGNSASTTLSGINIDMTPPSITATVISASQKYNGWYRSPVTVHFTCSDSLSGVASCPSDVTLSTDGAGQSVSGTAWDAAGNSGSTTVSGINIDTTAPTLSGSLTSSGHLSLFGWWNAPVTVNWACRDSLSGIATCPTSTTLGEGADQSVRATASDVAGNITTASLGGIDIDTTPPSTTISTPSGSILLPQTIRTAPPQVTGTASDDLSGVAGVEVTFTPASGGPAQVESATLICAGSARLNCTWSAPTPSAVGSYTVSAAAADEAANADPRPPSIKVVVL